MVPSPMVSQRLGNVHPELLNRARTNAIFSKNVYRIAADYDVSTQLSATLHKNKAYDIYRSLIKIKNNTI
jgi:hypothetical protein